MIRQTLSAVYDPVQANGTVYIGTQSGGIARLQGLQDAIDTGYLDTVDNLQWEWMNEGLGGGISTGLIVPELKLLNGTLFALLSGDAPVYSNDKHTGIYKWDSTLELWRHLRGTVVHPNDVGPSNTLWAYPTSFDIDPDANILWLTDMNANRNYLASGIWKSSDGGETWVRSIQVTFPYQIKVAGSRVYCSSSWSVSRWGASAQLGGWGYGGLLHSDDGGISWTRNEKVPLVANGAGVTIDPHDQRQIFYSFFGGGMFKGPIP